MRGCFCQGFGAGLHQYQAAQIEVIQIDTDWSRGFSFNHCFSFCNCFSFNSRNGFCCISLHGFTGHQGYGGAHVVAMTPRCLALGYVPGATPAKWARIWAERHPDVTLNLHPLAAADAPADR